MSIIQQISTDFLPGPIDIAPGKPRDYRALERFHYLPLRPATWAGVWTARYKPPDRHTRPSQIVAVAVLSYPSAVHRVRHRVFGLEPMSFGQKLRWANASLRTISRVIVHPQFRAIGLARAMVERLLADCPTRYVETSARMGRAHPLFEAAGMTRVDPEDADAPVYFWFDRHAAISPSPHAS